MCVCVCSQLRDAFIFQLTQGYSHYDRQLRNDLLVISNIVASACPNAPFVETGFVKPLTLFATFQEGQSSESSWNSWLVLGEKAVLSYWHEATAAGLPSNGNDSGHFCSATSH